MYQEHSLCEIPASNTKVWRYMSFERFSELIKSRSLYFCRIDRLGDQMEGIIPKETVSWWENQISSGRYTNQTIGSLHKYINYLQKDIRRISIVNCWQISEYERSTMWSAYGKNNKGVAIQTTVDGLINCFQNTSEVINIGKIKYYVPHAPMLNMSNTMIHCFSKQIYYENEHELRAFTEASVMPGYNPKYEIGTGIQIDLNFLIDEIFLSPNASKANKRKIERILKSAGLVKKVNYSAISDLSINTKKVNYCLQIKDNFKRLFKIS
jgi:hypothetical protein